MRGRDETSRDVRDDPAPSGTKAGADTTSRMTGTHTSDPYPDDDVRTVRGTDSTPGRHVAEDTTVREDTTVHESTRVHEDRGRKILPAKTSAAAVFALVFGLAALFSALTAILAPAAVLFGLIGIALAVVGFKMVKRPGVTGKGVATGGLVTAILGLVLGGAVLAGAAVVVNDEQRMDQLERWIDDVRADLPTGSELREELPS